MTAVNDYLYVYNPMIIVQYWTLDQKWLILAMVILTSLWLISSSFGMLRDKRLFDTIIPQTTGFSKVFMKPAEDEETNEAAVKTIE